MTSRGTHVVCRSMKVDSVLKILLLLCLQMVPKKLSMNGICRQGPRWVRAHGDVGIKIVLKMTLWQEVQMSSLKVEPKPFGLTNYVSVAK